MSLSVASVTPDSRFGTGFSSYETALASPATGVVLTASLPVICILLMSFSTEWFGALAFLPAYGLFWMSLRVAAKHQ
jgi:hypothetical protein